MTGTDGLDAGGAQIGSPEFWGGKLVLLCDVSPWQLGSAQGSTFSVAHLVWLPNPWTLCPLNTIQYNTIQCTIGLVTASAGSVLECEVIAG